jgi:hypothetical protein
MAQALQARSPEFKLQSHQKKIKRIEKHAINIMQQI